MRLVAALLLCTVSSATVAFDTNADSVIGEWKMFESVSHGLFVFHSATGRIYKIAPAKTGIDLHDSLTNFTAFPVSFIENESDAIMEGQPVTRLHKLPHRYGFPRGTLPGPGGKLFDISTMQPVEVPAGPGMVPLPNRK